MDTLSWLIGALVDHTPWWLWALLLLVPLGWFYPVLAPLWAALPGRVKALIGAAVAAVFIYLAGRNRGAAGALSRAQQKEQRDADRIRDEGNAARARAERDALGDGLRDDDGWRRQD